ncbi:TBC1 domain family member 5-like isoform X5 [Rhizophagus clarus]|uniref:TBC1 domain family member 5-like isoform X5 n=1 Tax=Rhizophagus clarus TaxID=94130 RepID=A0A8H3L6Z6_9GLOM|nr:TBC1 domain family member 5-like isoform X5 [Rhizophagus clarus]
MDSQSFEKIKAKWDVIFKDPLLSLTSLREKGVEGNICSKGLRSVCWKLYLAYLPGLDNATWPLALHKERQHYTDLRQKYITSPENDSNSANDLNINNPLSLDQANPWQEYFKDTELRKIIRQDVERTFPDNEYFRTPLSQSRLLDILFIYCKMNQDVSYRQGMHELLAPILWVVDKESIPSSNGYAVENNEDTIIKQTLNAEYVEHDTFALFSALMKAAKEYYEYNDEIFNKKPVKRAQGSDLEFARLIKNNQAEVAKATPVFRKCNKIYEYLQTIDPELHERLNELEIEPQLYGIRWIRLLFGREFPLDKVLTLWDGIFAEDPTLRIVDHVCVAMMLLIRDDLLKSDYTGCLSMLMRYPPTSDTGVLIKQAIYLRDHSTPEGGACIIKQNALRTDRGAVINKAVINAYDEVKKNVLRKQDGQFHTEHDRSGSIDVSQRYANQLMSNHVDQLSSEIQNVSFEEFTKLKEQNRQMALVVQKSIEILEQEILGRTKSKEIISATDAEKIEKSSTDDSESRSSFEYISGNNNEESTTHEISVLHALHGLKHIRDVLNGSIKEFNSHIMETVSLNGEDHDHWEVVDDGVSVVSVPGTEDETASVTKEVQTKHDKIITHTSSPNNIIKTSVIETISTKPVVQPITTLPLQPSPPSSTKVTPQQYSKVTSPSISTSNEKPKVTSSHSATKTPKPKSKLKLEDILDDMEKSETGTGTPKSSIASNSKYSWMIEGYTDDDDNSLFNPKRASIGSFDSLSGFSLDKMSTIDFSKDKDDVFKSNSTSNQRKTRNSVIAHPTSSSLRSERINNPLRASSFTSKDINQENNVNIGSTSNEGKLNNHIVTAINTPVAPVDDPLGVS